MTMTSFANDRSRAVREVVDESVPVLISRRGRIMAAVIPLEAGTYESDIFRDAGRERLAVMSERSDVELDDSAVDEILSADDPAAAASARGIDTSDWATLNPPSQD
jgi:PHD/YefM family antitoxin component YafN of YafNO toxin-antitoxin module